MNPYTIIAGILLLIATAFGGAHVGKKIEREKWQEEKVQLQAAQTKEIKDEFDRHVLAEKTNQEKARKASEKHEQALADINSKYATDVAAVKRAGGLRIPRAVCTSAGTASAPAAGAGRPDEGAAATVRLPDSVENDLFALAHRADQLAEQCRALQGWVRDNGLYGPAP